MKTALVTGGSSGLGWAITQGLQNRGFHVLSPCMFAMDISKPQDVEAMSAKINQLDVLVNNAGVYPEKEDILRFNTDLMLQTLHVNAVGTANVTRIFWDRLKQSKGRVINISSRMGLATKQDPTRASYAISKAALNFVTRMFALQGLHDGVSVNAMCPGHCRTKMGGPDAPRSPEEGAETAVWLATDAPKEATGGFYIDKEPVPLMVMLTAYMPQ